MDNSLFLKSINQLYEEKFYIPSYQRGYRWTENQVTQLLEDIWNFAQNPPKSEEGKEPPFYCLQPIVVKRRESDWEVIDGQQRLTTIDLIINYFNEMWIGKSKIKTPEISYETRPNSADFIKNIEITNSEDQLDFKKKFVEICDQIIVKSNKYDCNDNIDFFHISNAYKAIHYWVKKQGNFDYNKLQSVFLNDSKVIWYEVQETEHNKVVDIFTRLNTGKIPLTNSELIKAMFLMKDNFSKNDISLKQIQIASEWDLIERTLQNNDFWYFIYNPNSANKYEIRIEFIFDLMAGKKTYSDFYSTFFYFNQRFENKQHSVESMWLEIKQFFLTFEEWYNDFELYHLVGYLVDCNYPIVNLAKKSKTENKSTFKKTLKTEIKKQLRDNENKLPILEELSFDHNKILIKKILLLFNIETILQSQKQDTRFPFYKYKYQNWDIEHIDSLAEKTIKGDNNRKDWLADMLEYFKDLPNSNEYTLLQKLPKDKKISDEVFDDAFKKIKKFFKDDDNDEKNKISNLALLDATTNRSYKNSFFPIKRKKIIENDMKGIFVPIATKNVFLKYYTSQAKDLIYWTENDADKYMKAIKKLLNEYLTQN